MQNISFSLENQHSPLPPPLSLPHWVLLYINPSTAGLLSLSDFQLWWCKGASHSCVLKHPNMSLARKERSFAPHSADLSSAVAARGKVVALMGKAWRQLLGDTSFLSYINPASQ